MSGAAPLSRLRNIGIMAHIDAGKTTTTERILFYTGILYRMGSVDDGTATTDYQVDEQLRGITITSASTTCHWVPSRGGVSHQINLIDTPGHVDFTIEVERCLRVLDGAVALFCAVSGVEPQSETVWRQANKYGIPRIAFINKMDRLGASVDRTLEMMEERLSAIPLRLQLPIGTESDFVGVIDLIEVAALIYEDDTLGASWRVEAIPEDMFDEVDFFREEMLDTLAEHDEAFCEAYLADAYDAELIRAAIRRATLSLKLVPTLCGASFHNKGVQPLLDAVVDYLPSPVDVPDVEGVLPEEFHRLGERRQQISDAETITRKADIGAPFSALAFKVLGDRYLGQLTFLRVYSGELESDVYVLNANKGKKERIGDLYRIHANSREKVDRVRAGDIAAAVGLRVTTTGDTLSDASDPVILAAIDFPEPVIRITIEPDTLEDQERLEAALASIALEDPSFRVSVHPESGQTMIAGMGELHLDIIRTQLVRDHRVNARIGSPEVAYRETVGAKIIYTGRLERHNVARGWFASVDLEIGPNPRGGGITFSSSLPTGALPREYVAAVELGVREAAETGVLGGYPVVDVGVNLVDADFHEVDSSESAFKAAASIGLRKGLREASPQLLEPIMELEVVTPDQYIGAVVGDLNSRRGTVRTIEPRVGGQVVKAFVPLKELFGYVGVLRGQTSGRATFTMIFDHYGVVPRTVSAEVLGNF